MNVVCVRQGTKYGPEYVAALRRQVAEFTDRELICLTDQSDTPGPVSYMVHGLTGWWSKIELLSPEQEALRPCFYLDLDTFIRAPIHDLLEPVDELWLIQDFGSKRWSNSGLMKLPKDTNEIWKAAQNWQGPWADGEFLKTQPHQRLTDQFAGIHSYKFHCREHARGRIVCFHGRPRPHEAEGWAAEHWRHYTQGTDSA